MFDTIFWNPRPSKDRNIPFRFVGGARENNDSFNETTDRIIQLIKIKKNDKTRRLFRK